MYLAQPIHILFFHKQYMSENGGSMGVLFAVTVGVVGPALSRVLCRLHHSEHNNWKVGADTRSTTTIP
jgi:hypothetical protein